MSRPGPGARRAVRLCAAPDHAPKPAEPLYTAQAQAHAVGGDPEQPAPDLSQVAPADVIHLAISESSGKYATPSLSVAKLEVAPGLRVSSG